MRPNIDNERDSPIHRLLNIVGDVGHNINAYPTVGYVTSAAPLEIYLDKADITINADVAWINPELLPRREFATINILTGDPSIVGNHDAEILYDVGLAEGDAVYVVCDIDEGQFYVIARLTGGG